MVKITIPESVQKYYPIFKEGDTEDVVNLIQRRDSIISDKKLRVRYTTCAGLIAKKKKVIKKLQAKTQKFLKI